LFIFSSGSERILNDVDIRFSDTKLMMAATMTAINTTLKPIKTLSRILLNMPDASGMFDFSTKEN
jgi:hypothetical protein